MNYLHRSEIQSFNTRNKDKFVLPKPRTEYMKRLLSNILVLLYGTHHPKIFKTLILYQASKDKSVKYYWTHLVINLILFYSLDQCTVFTRISAALD